MRSTDRLGCVAHREKSTCSNLRTVKLIELERRVLSGLKEKMLKGELFAEFADEFRAEVERIRARSTNNQRELGQHLIKISDRIARVVDAIAAGTASKSLVAKLTDLEDEKEKVESEMQNSHPAPREIELPTNLPDIYHDHVTNIETKIKSASGENDSAKRILRSFVERIVVHPGNHRGETEIEVFGSLAAILEVTNNTPTDATYLQSVVEVVPRGGFEPPTPRFSVACSTN